MTEANYPGTFNAIVATATPSTVNTFISCIGIDALDHTPDAVLKHGCNLLHHVLNAVKSEYRERTGRLRPYTKHDDEAQFGATRVTNTSDLAKRLRDTPSTSQLLRGGKAPMLFAYGGDDTILGPQTCATQETCLNQLQTWWTISKKTADISSPTSYPVWITGVTQARAWMMISTKTVHKGRFET